MKAKNSLFWAILAAIFYFFYSNGAYAQTVRAYMCMGPDSNAAVVKAIKDKIGITVNQSFQSCGEVEARLKAEAPNFNADIAVVVSAQTAMAKKNGWILPYKSSGWQGVSPMFIDPDGYSYCVGTYSYVLMGNKDKLKEKGYEMPKSWKDLLDPKWKGQIVMPSPLTSGTANLMVFSFLSLYGEQEGWKYLEALDKNIHHYTRSGAAPQDLVSRGEFLLGIATDDGVQKRIEQGYPLIWTIPEEGVGYEGAFVFILKGAQDVESVKKVIDAFGSQEVGDVLAKFGYMSARPADNPLYGKTIPKYIKIDFGWAAENKPRVNDIWKQKFRLAQ
jgi:iron(III) transport system substrate-binding protein